jgi:hypothetical protein
LLSAYTVSFEESKKKRPLFPGERDVTGKTLDTLEPAMDGNGHFGLRRGKIGVLTQMLFCHP